MRPWVPALIVGLIVSAGALSAPNAAQQPSKPAPGTTKAAPSAQATTAKPSQTTAPKPAQTAVAKPAAATPKPTVQMFNGKPLPPVQYVCTMVGDEGVLEDKPGKCPNPKCGMDLKAVRLTEAYSSVSHPMQFIQLGPGKDRIDGSALVPITASIFFTCPGSDEHLMDPGKCADGSARKMSLERRPHGDHNPRHGGQFFMAEDKWHHLEGTYPNGGPFRVFFYDDFTRPMATKDMTATVALVDKDDKEVATFPLKPGKAINALETPLKGAASPSPTTAPLKLNLRVAFDAKDSPHLFNFTFREPTTEAVAPAVTTKAAPPSPPPASAKTPATAATTSAQSAPPTPAPVATGALVNVAASSLTMSRAEATQVGQELPNNAAELLKLLELRADEVKTLVQDGNFGMVYVPTMMAKDVALAIGDHVSELPDRQRVALNSAVRRLVLSAWRLDQYGDLGNREKITDAHSIFAAAVADIKAAYAQSR